MPAVLPIASRNVCYKSDMHNVKAFRLVSFSDFLLELLGLCDFEAQ